MSPNQLSSRALSLMLGVFVLQLLACSDRLEESQPLNQPPETTVSADSPAVEGDGRVVQIWWSGTDSDGAVESFRYRILDDALSRDEVLWIETSESGVALHFSAEDVAERRDRTMTLQVSAVDDQGAIDATPASVAFSPITLAPTAHIVIPRPAISCVYASTVPAFEWTAFDADTKGGMPEATRYLLLEVDHCFTQAEFEANNPVLDVPSDDPGWSEWIPYTGAASVILPPQDAGKQFFFVVQARDVDGAVTKTFDWNDNVFHLQTTEGKFPVLLVQDEFIGLGTFIGKGGLKAYQILAGQPLSLRWAADASEYVGFIDAYRYGWNIVDPEDPNDPGWAVPWGNGSQWREAPTRTFTQGSPNFVVQTRDQAGTITRATYQFSVVPVPDGAEQRDLLLVDDWPMGPTPTEQAIEMEWDQKWEQLLTSILPNFQSTDVIDAQEEAARLTPELLVQYRSVVWFVGPSNNTFLHTRIAPINRDYDNYNWLKVYQAFAGNLLLTGPGAMYASIERDPPTWVLPVIFDVPAGGDLGFGQVELPTGTVNRGTLRWPYRGFCLESIDLVRPPAGQIFGEAPLYPMRSLSCDALLQADVDSDFLAANPSAAGSVVALRPSAEREQLDPFYRFQFEEFYNVNVTVRSVNLMPRACQIPMFRLLSRRDGGLIPDPEQNCVPSGLTESPLAGVPVAVMSTTYAGTKPLVGSADFIWGFHPLAFQEEDVRAALRWIFAENWELPYY